MHAIITAGLAGIFGGCVTYVAIRAARPGRTLVRAIVVPRSIRAKHARA
jgi:ABC-type sulfate transport system permease component